MAKIDVCCPECDTDLKGDQYNKIDKHTGRPVGELKEGLTVVTAEELKIMMDIDLKDLFE